MNDDKDEAIKELQAAMMQETQMIADLGMRLETMRGLLYKHGVFSPAEHDQVHAIRRQEWNDFVQARLPAAVDVKKHAVLRRLLVEFEGKPQ